MAVINNVPPPPASTTFADLSLGDWFWQGNVLKQKINMSSAYVPSGVLQETVSGTSVVIVAGPVDLTLSPGA